MDILYLRNSRGYHMDILEILQKRGHRPEVVEIPDEDAVLLGQLAEEEGSILLEKFCRAVDMVFSLDYYPCISVLCMNLGKRYVSWCIEPPFSNLYSSTIVNEVNKVFLADKWLAENLQLGGISNVSYLPEGVNLDRCERVKQSISREGELAECSLIGKTKAYTWQELFGAERLFDATVGYLDGILSAQNLVYGLDLFTGGLPEYLYKDLMGHSKLHLRNDSVQSIQEFYAEQCFYPRTTAVGRNVAAKALTLSSKVDLYTDDAEFTFEGVRNRGELPYEKSLEVIGRTLVNVSISPRGLRDGIYGQSLQVLGMGGFLIADYKPALMQEFVPGEEVIVYEDMKDLQEKVKYYLEHPAEREAIAQRAYEKVGNNHSLDRRIEEIERSIQGAGIC